ncbi:amidohydrolase [Brachybacterium huguangmaarense]|uniref:Amidohydrolase n=1 Tax=Brachybacterium huguangmaarense TaxID=1652028 RepID=A0ABY6G2H5_9MICO|nr:amidohydrolase [Brachybacterium huguangmaarense]UYG16849.1 amidohydrolase [Brachybacterium huguangmaarense]
MTTAIVNAHIHAVSAPAVDGTVLLEDGRIRAVGRDVTVPEGAEVIDAAGGWLVPGFVDAHVHLGIHEEGEGWAGDDTNERTDPVMAAARALDAINPADRGFEDALRGGVTTVNVNPGSANPIGGLAVALHTHGRVVDEMVLRSPSGLKSALGENPKRVHGEAKRTPSTRLGTALVIRTALAKAREWMAKEPEDRPVDLVSEALARVLSHEIPWRQHCHRADDIATALRLADEFGYDLVLDHGTEAYRIADVVAEHGVPVLYGPLIITRTKIETRERSAQAPGILTRAGVKVSIITDHPVVPIDFLVHEASLAMKEGLDHDDAIRAITLNPAEVLGLDARIGSIEVGKDADVVLWEGDPLDTRNRALRVWIGGDEVMRYDAEARACVIADR